MDAKIFTYTVVRSSTAEFSGRVPYCTAILEGEGGVRFPALLEGYRDGDPVAVGQTVRQLATQPGEPARYAL